MSFQKFRLAVAFPRSLQGPRLGTEGTISVKAMQSLGRSTAQTQEYLKGHVHSLLICLWPDHVVTNPVDEYLWQLYSNHTFFCVSYDIPQKRWTLIDLFLLLGSVPFSHSVGSDSLRPHGLQHARPPCLSPTPRAYSNSCPLSRWCHPTISSSVIPFSSCLQSFPASGSFQLSQFLHQVVKVLEFQLQNQSFQWIFRIDFL